MITTEWDDRSHTRYLKIMEKYMKKRETTDYVCIHCSATPPSHDIGMKEIRVWHMDDNGWSDIGYHFVITRRGVIQKGRDDWRQGAHEPKINKMSVAVCLVGGVAQDKVNGRWVPENNFTKQQWESLKELVIQLEVQYPGAKVVGHNQFCNKACPSFIVPEWYNSFIQKPAYVARHVHLAEPVSEKHLEKVAWNTSPLNVIGGAWRRFMGSAVSSADEAYVPRMGRKRKENK